MFVGKSSLINLMLIALDLVFVVLAALFPFLGHVVLLSLFESSLLLFQFFNGELLLMEHKLVFTVRVKITIVTQLGR